MAQLWRLAQVWYRDRMAPDWLRPTRDVLQRRLAEVGLTGEFWQLR